MATPMKGISEESEDGGDTDGTTSTVEEPEPSHRHRSLVDMISPVHTRRAFEDVPPSPAKTRSYGKAKKTKDREPFCKGFGVVYLGKYKQAHKEIAFISCRVLCRYTTVRNKLVHVLVALLRLKQLTRKDYTDITTCLPALL